MRRDGLHGNDLGVSPHVGRVAPSYGLGSLPWQAPPVQQYAPGDVPPGQGMYSKAFPGHQGFQPPPPEPQGRGAPPGVVGAARDVAKRVIWNTQPSPLEAPPFRASVLQAFNRAVIAPPTTPGNALGANGAQEVADAESAISGQTVSVLTPATTAAFVTVVSFTVEYGRAFTVYSVGAWGHDYLGCRNAILWRLRVADTIVMAQQELGLQAGVDNPLRVSALAKAGTTVILEARNLDVNSGTLLEGFIFGWSYPLLQASDDDFFSLIDPPLGPSDQGRFAAGA